MIVRLVPHTDKLGDWLLLSPSLARGAYQAMFQGPTPFRSNAGVHALAQENTEHCFSGGGIRPWSERFASFRGQTLAVLTVADR